MSCHRRRQRVIALLLLLSASAVVADVTFYEWPYYKGRSYTLSPNETTTTNIPFRESIQSIKLSNNASLITYDYYRSGANATWYRSVVYTGKWVNRIFSFDVRNATALPTPPPATIEAPWRFLGTWEGFMMVRFAAKSSHPECYAVNGVNCLLGENVDDLLPLLAAYESNRTSGNNDTSLSTFPAPCGPARREHWGNEGYSSSDDWCWAAKQLLQQFDAHGSLAHCVSGPLGIAAVRSFQQRWYCVSKVQWSSFRECRLFSNRATCQASVERLLLRVDGLYSYGESNCKGNEASCVDPPSYNRGYALPSGDGLVGSVIAGLFAFGVLGALGGYFIRRKDRDMAASRPGIEATVCSSKDGDDDEDDDFPVYRASNYVRDDSRSEQT